LISRPSKGRQTNRQKDKQTERQTNRKTNKEKRIDFNQNNQSKMPLKERTLNIPVPKISFSRKKPNHGDEISPLMSEERIGEEPESDHGELAQSWKSSQSLSQQSEVLLSQQSEVLLSPPKSKNTHSLPVSRPCFRCPQRMSQLRKRGGAVGAQIKKARIQAQEEKSGDDFSFEIVPVSALLRQNDLDTLKQQRKLKQRKGSLSPTKEDLEEWDIHVKREAIKRNEAAQTKAAQRMGCSCEERSHQEERGRNGETQRYSATPPSDTARHFSCLGSNHGSFPVPKPE
jgi:hypothetical protein